MKTSAYLRFTIFLVSFLCIWVACQSKEQKPVESKYAVIAAKPFKLSLQKEKNPQLVDVRTAAEFEQGAIDKAINIDITNTNFVQKIATLDRNKPIYVYCQSGGRSATACTKLKEMGFQNIMELDGGYASWKDQMIKPTPQTQLATE